MELATLYTRALNGINAVNVTVEVHLSNGLPAFSIVGLPEAAVSFVGWARFFAHAERTANTWAKKCAHPTSSYQINCF